MRAIAMIPLIALAALGISCNSRKKAVPSASRLIEADQAFCRATSERGLEGWLSWFHPQAAIFPAGQAVVKGIDSIASHYRKTKFDPKPLKWEPASAEIAASGEMGFTYGYWELPGRDKKGKDTLFRGKYLTVWRMDAKGAWKVFADIGTN